MRKVKLFSDMEYKPASEIKASAAQCSTRALLRMLRHGGSQPRNQEGALHLAWRGKNAKAFLIILYLRFQDDVKEKKC